MMRFELGLEKPDPRRAIKSALTIGGSYAVGGLIPLGAVHPLADVADRAVRSRSALTLAALFAFGFVKGRFTGARPLRSALQTTSIGGLAAAARVRDRASRRGLSGSRRWTPLASRSCARARDRKLPRLACSLAPRQPRPRRCPGGVADPAFVELLSRHRRGLVSRRQLASRSSSGATTRSVRCSPPCARRARRCSSSPTSSRTTRPARLFARCARRGGGAGRLGCASSRTASDRSRRGAGRSGRACERRASDVRLFHPIGFAAALPRVPRPPQDPGGGPRRRVHRRDEHRRGVRLRGRSRAAAARPRAPSRSGATRTRGSRAPAAWEMAVVFEEGWRHAGGDPLGLGPGEARPCSASRREASWSSTRGPAAAPSSRRGVRLDRRGAARSRVWITMAYFAPRREPIEICARGAPRRRRADDPVPARTDVWLVRHAGHGFYSGLLARRRADLRVPGGRPPRQDAGGRRPASAVVGSSNLRLAVLRAQRGVQLRHPRRRDRGAARDSIRDGPRELAGDRAFGLAPAKAGSSLPRRGRAPSVSVAVIG